MKPYLLWILVLLLASAGCVRKLAQSPVPQRTLAVDNSYMDLAAGSRLRIVIPLLKEGDTRIEMQPQRKTGNTIELSASNLIGYQVARYFVEGRSHAQVRLRFIGAQITRNGKTEALSSEPHLPFSMPLKWQHLRLIYYIRASRSDHNMAIAGSKNMEALIAFTKRLEEDPSACEAATDVFCSWIPPGVAVRPE